MKRIEPMKMKILGWLLATGALTQLVSGAMARTARQWEPIEWQFDNRTCDGNPFDLVAKAEFRHEDGKHRITTELYYAGGTTWVLRFTGAAPGQWSFTTRSRDPELDGHRGEVTIEANPGAAGFLTAYGNKWGRLGREEAFVPQIVSYAAPVDYYQKPGKIDADLKTWFEQHGFNGLHTFVGMAWFDIAQGRSGYQEVSSDDPNPDPRTFEALELLITKTHRAGGMVHLWSWGDEQRKMTTVRWGLNGKVDQRLQRYICARLGPLPGWSMGYGFDLQEWVNRGQLATWHRFMHDHLGWSHFLGARAPDLAQIYDGLDYSSYQQWRPTYDTYVEALEKRSPSKPVFLEDRFRVRINVYPEKDYDLDMTRRGLWHSTMAGGAANIWAYLINAPKDGSSATYPNREQILTYSRFWRGRFFKEMVRNNARTDGVCLEVPGAFCVFYREDTDAIQMDLAGMKAPLRPVAVDTRTAYREIPLADLAPAPGQLFRAAHRSDWAIAVGRTRDVTLPATAPTALTNSLPEAAPATGPLRLHPTNPRYFTDGTTSRDGSLKAVYLTGSHHWNNLQDSGRLGGPLTNRFDYAGYVQRLAGLNHNCVRLWAWEGPAWWFQGGQNDQYYEPLPWARTRRETALDGKPKFDLDQFSDEYFKRLRSRVLAAREKGIYVSVMLFQGWSIYSHGYGNPWPGHPFNQANNVNALNGDANGDGEGREVHTLAVPAVTRRQEAYVRKVIDTLNDLDNVLYEITNETAIWSKDWQYHMIRFIKKYEATKPKQHPVGITAFDSGREGSMDALLASPADWISPQNDGRSGDYQNDPPAADGRKVIVSDTDHLWGVGGDRAWVWKSFTRGHHPIYMDPLSKPDWVRSSEAEMEGARQAMGHTRTFAERMNLAATTPQSKLASTRYCLANPGLEYLVYQPKSGESFTVELSAGTYRYEWFHPAKGESGGSGNVQAAGGRQEFKAPFAGEAVLYLRIQKPAPGRRT